MRKPTHPRSLFRKVPEITAIFWAVKLLTTALGESTSDFLVFRINPYLAVALGGVGLVTALVLQLTVRRYIPWIYWLTVAMVAVFGTMAADALHLQLSVPYLLSTLFFAASLGLIFTIWYITEKTLSIHSISSPRRELFYWATVMATFALGTAAGDLTAITLSIGYLAAGLVFIGLIALPLVAYVAFGLDEILAFWIAYIITRPLGASFADWLGKPHSVGGIGLGDLFVSAVLAALITLFVTYMTINKHETKLETTNS